MWTKALFSSTDCIKCQNYELLTTQSQQRSKAWANHPCEDRQIISVLSSVPAISALTIRVTKKIGYQRKLMAGDFWGLFFSLFLLFLVFLLFFLLHIWPQSLPLKPWHVWWAQMMLTAHGEQKVHEVTCCWSVFSDQFTASIRLSSQLLVASLHIIDRV